MNALLPPHNIPRNSNPSRPDAGPILAAYMAALEAYQQQRTAKGRAVLFQSYRQWIRSFLDDEGEAEGEIFAPPWVPHESAVKQASED